MGDGTAGEAQVAQCGGAAVQWGGGKSAGDIVVSQGDVCQTEGVEREEGAIAVGSIVVGTWTSCRIRVPVVYEGEEHW